MEGGNLGAPPKPPRAGSYSCASVTTAAWPAAASRSAAAARASSPAAPGTVIPATPPLTPPLTPPPAPPPAAPLSLADCSASAAAILWAWLMTASRSSLQARATPRVSRWK